jgi:hypothetical protein
MLGPFGFQPKGCFASFFEDETECILTTALAAVPDILAR